MDWVVCTYLSNKNWIDLVKDIVFFAGAITLIKYLLNKRFQDKSREIQNNLNSRKDIEENLHKYVEEKSDNNVVIAIRFVYWKNYPYNLNNDAFPHALFLYAHEDNTVRSGYIDNTGINFEERFNLSGASIYIDQNGIFFIDNKNQEFVGFNEIKNPKLTMHMPYHNIINYDFREFIEYEPVFYIRYPYTKRRKLYDDEVIIRGKDISPINTKQSRMLKKYSYIRLKFIKLKLHLLGLFIKS